MLASSQAKQLHLAMSLPPYHTSCNVKKACISVSGELFLLPSQTLDKWVTKAVQLGPSIVVLVNTTDDARGTQWQGTNIQNLTGDALRAFQEHPHLHYCCFPKHSTYFHRGALPAIKTGECIATIQNGSLHVPEGSHMATDLDVPPGMLILALGIWEHVATATRPNLSRDIKLRESQDMQINPMGI